MDAREPKLVVGEEYREQHEVTIYVPQLRCCIATRRCWRCYSSPADTCFPCAWSDSAACGCLWLSQACHCCDLRRTVISIACFQMLVGAFLTALSIVLLCDIHGIFPPQAIDNHLYGLLGYQVARWAHCLITGIIGLLASANLASILEYSPQSLYLSRVYRVFCYVNSALNSNPAAWNPSVWRFHTFGPILAVFLFVPLMWDIYFSHIARSFAIKLTQQRSGVFLGRAIVNEQERPNHLLDCNHAGAVACHKPPDSQDMVVLDHLSDAAMYAGVIPEPEWDLKDGAASGDCSSAMVTANSHCDGSTRGSASLSDELELVRDSGSWTDEEDFYATTAAATTAAAASAAAAAAAWAPARSVWHRAAPSHGVVLPSPECIEDGDGLVWGTSVDQDGRDALPTVILQLGAPPFGASLKGGLKSFRLRAKSAWLLSSGGSTVAATAGARPPPLQRGAEAPLTAPPPPPPRFVPAQALPAQRGFMSVLLPATGRGGRTGALPRPPAAAAQPQSFQLRKPVQAAPTQQRPIPPLHLEVAPKAAGAPATPLSGTHPQLRYTAALHQPLPPPCAPPAERSSAGQVTLLPLSLTKPRSPPLAESAAAAAATGPGPTPAMHACHRTERTAPPPSAGSDERSLVLGPTAPAHQRTAIRRAPPLVSGSAAGGRAVLAGVVMPAVLVAGGAATGVGSREGSADGRALVVNVLRTPLPLDGAGGRILALRVNGATLPRSQGPLEAPAEAVLSAAGSAAVRRAAVAAPTMVAPLPSDVGALAATAGHLR